MGTEAGGVWRASRYEIELPITEGTLGRVFVARDSVLGRRVALKVLRGDVGSAEARARLAERVRERARAFAALTHPAFVSLHDMGEEAGDLYLVFEFVPGATLAERVSAGPLPPAEVAAIGRALGAALTHAHAAGYVHGDVKAENVMAAQAGPRLTDPGFASISEDRAEPATAFDDQLALAETLYEALTGKRPGAGEARVPPSALAPNLRSFPHLDTIFDRALADSPRKRFTSCEVLGNVLAHEIEGADPYSPARASASSIVPRSTRRWQNAAAGVAVLVILTLLLLGRREPRGPQAAPADGSVSAPVAVPPPPAQPRPRPPRPDAGASVSLPPLPPLPAPSSSP